MSDNRTAKDTPDSSSISEFLQGIPLVLSAISGLTIFASILYDWAYFSVSSPSAIQFLTINDHISMALQWLPRVIIVYFAPSLVNVYVFGQNLAIPKRKRDQSTADMGKKSLLRSSFSSAAPFVVVPIIFLISSGADKTVAIMVGGVLMLIRSIYLNHTGKISDSNYLVFVIVISTVMYSLYEGNSNGIEDFKTNIGNSAIITKDGYPIYPSIILREMDKGVLIRTTDSNKIIFVPWSDVARLIYDQGNIDDRLIVCKEFNMFCSSADKRASHP